MVSGTFEKTSLDWQLQQFSQRLGEWFERLLDSRTPNRPNLGLPEFPEWLFRGLFWLMVIGTVAWASWQLYELLEPYLATYWRSGRGNPSIAISSQPERSLAEWVRQARTAQQQGDYRAACRALYMATLQQLSDRGMISQELSRTDGEYLNLMQTQNLPRPYQVLIRTHERLCFDRVPASLEVYNRCWQAYQEIERL